MAHIEIHALSVKLAGTFEAHVFSRNRKWKRQRKNFRYCG